MKGGRWTSRILAVTVAAILGLILIGFFPLPDKPIPPGWIFGPGAALFASMGLADLRRQLRVGWWPRVDCTIEFTLVEPFRRGTTLPVVGFTYPWEGVEHLGTDLRSSMSGVSRDAARAETAGYRPGARHECSVNPQKPAEAVLRTEVTPFVPGLLIGIALLFLAGWVAFVEGWLGG